MKRVLLGMSGGVDSSVAAYLLKQQGYEVVGVTIDLFDGNKEEGCTSSHAINDASKVCKLLDIEHYVVEYKCAFKKYVILLKIIKKEKLLILVLNVINILSLVCFGKKLKN